MLLAKLPGDLSTKLHFIGWVVATRNTVNGKQIWGENVTLCRITFPKRQPTAE